MTFCIFFLLPTGDPAYRFAGRQPNPETIAQIRHEFGLDHPWYVQYGLYVKHLFLGDRPISHRIAHLYAVVDELHQIHVGRQDRYLGSGIDGVTRISRDQIVRLEVRHFDLADVKRSCRSSNMFQLWTQIVRHLASVGLILIVYAVTETGTGRVEDYRHMVGIGFASIFIQHVAE